MCFLQIKTHVPKYMCFCRSCTLARKSKTRVTLVVDSNPDYLRHMKKSAYRCFIPDLTGFTAFHCAGPNYQHHLPGADQTLQSLTRGFNPAIADCGQQGTANTPSSTIVGRKEGIRTLVPVSRQHAFQACTFSRSVTFPQLIICIYKLLQLLLQCLILYSFNIIHNMDCSVNQDNPFFYILILFNFLYRTRIMTIVNNE